MPNKRGLKNKGKAASSKIRSIFTDKKKLAVLVIVILSVSTIAIYTAIPKAVIVDQHSTGDIQMGAVDCSIDVETKPLAATMDGYVPIYGTEGESEIDTNSPWYIGEQEISAMEFTVNIVAKGNYVDWSTLSITVVATCNGIPVGTTTVPETPLAKDEGSFSEIVTFMITNFDLYLDIEFPSSTLEDGTLLFDMDCVTTATGSLNDVKGNELTDVVSINNPWNLNSLPDGSFGLIGSEELIAPAFESAPTSTRIFQGESLPLHWVANDDNPDEYIIRTYTTGDGSHIVASGTWASGEVISYSQAGDYGSIEPGDIDLHVSCTVTDSNGQQAINSVLIQITVPVIQLAPTFAKADGPYSNPVSGAVELFITFKPESTCPSSFKIYQNSLEIDGGSWLGGDIILFVDFLYDGPNDFKCVVVDILGRSAIYTHTVITPEDDTGVPTNDDGTTNAPFSLGDIQGISLFMGIFFVGVGTAIWYIMKKRR